MDNSDSPEQGPGGPASRYPKKGAAKTRRRLGRKRWDLDLEGYTASGDWHLGKSSGGHSEPWSLVVLEPVDVSIPFAMEAGAQARLVSRHMQAEGYELGAGGGAAWMSALWTIASACESWEITMRHVRAGLASTGGGRWPGWCSLLARDPHYSLRRSFLEATRWGWGIPGGSRFDSGLAWDPQTESLAEAHSEWVQGKGPMP